MTREGIVGCVERAFWKVYDLTDKTIKGGYLSICGMDGLLETPYIDYLMGAINSNDKAVEDYELSHKTAYMMRIGQIDESYFQGRCGLVETLTPHMAVAFAGFNKHDENESVALLTAVLCGYITFERAIEIAEARKNDLFLENFKQNPFDQEEEQEPNGWLEAGE